MDRKSKRNVVIIGIICFLFIIIKIIIFNIKSNNTFWNISVDAAINIVIAIIFAYYLTEQKNDQRELKASFINLIDKIEIDINDTKAYQVNEVDNKICYTKQRQISNRIDLLEKLSNEFKIEEQVSYIKNQFKEYKEHFGEHYQDTAFMEKADVDFQRYISNINCKLDIIRIKVYYDKYH